MFFACVIIITSLVNQNCTADQGQIPPATVSLSNEQYYGTSSLSHQMHNIIFCGCHLNSNVARWCNGHSSSHLPVLEYTDVDHCGLMCSNDLHQTQGLPESGVSLISKRSSLKRKNHFLAVLSPMTLSTYTAKMFLAASVAFSPIWTQREKYVRNVPISPLGTVFPSVPGSTH